MQRDEDFTRKMLRSLLTLLLTTLATWLANKLVDAILGAEEEDLIDAAAERVGLGGR